MLCSHPISSSPSSEAIKESIERETFPLYHDSGDQRLPRSSGIIKLHPHSLHQIIHFGDVDEEFLETVRITSIEGHHVHNAVRDRLYRLMYDGKLAYDLFELPDEPEYVADERDLTDIERTKADRCMEWILHQKPVVLHPPEQTITSSSLRYGGSPDFVCSIDNQIAVIDFKTGKLYQKTHGLQVESYAQLIAREKGLDVAKVGTLLLGMDNKCGYKCKVSNVSAKQRGQFMELLDQWYDMFPEPFEQQPYEKAA